MKRSLPTNAGLALLVLSLLLPSLACGQETSPRRKGGNPEGQPLKRAVPATVQVERDLIYARYGTREVKLDLYLPRPRPAAAIPGIIVVHGGGWRSGDKTRFSHIATALAEQGFAAACIGYRLLPEVEFPAPILDCKAAVRWVRANAARYGIDPDRLGAIGGSAGGHLVAMLGTSAHVPTLEGEGGNPGRSSRVQAVVAMATPADMTAFGERANINRELVGLISPVTHVSRDSAPVLLLHGTRDNLVPMAQSELLREKYHRAGAPADLVRIEGGSHAFWNEERYFPDVMKRSVDFFRRTLAAAK